MTADIELVARTRLAGEGISVSGWGNGPDDRYPPHAHDYDKVLVVIEGSIAFRLAPAGEVQPLVAGDRLDLPAGTVHAADVGSEGVRCLEGHLPRGSLHRGLRRMADWVQDPEDQVGKPTATVRRKHP
jgi:quercetin dioxygenase-like cupin family protein